MKLYRKRQAISTVVATILMVAMTVVLTALLFVMVSDFAGEQDVVRVPLGYTTETDEGVWIIHIVKSSVRHEEITGWQLLNASSGTTIEGFNMDTEQAMNGSYNIVYNDNSKDGFIRSPDSIVIYHGNLTTGAYRFVLSSSEGRVISQPFRKA